MATDIEKGWRGLAIAMVAMIVLVFVGLVGSYLLTITSVNNERAQRQQDRAPACALALHLVNQESGQNKTADMALYNATGCPQIIRATR